MKSESIKVCFRLTTRLRAFNLLNLIPELQELGSIIIKVVFTIIGRDNWRRVSTEKKGFEKIS